MNHCASGEKENLFIKTLCCTFFFPAPFKMSTVHEILCKLSLEGDVSISFSLGVFWQIGTLDDSAAPFPCTSKENEHKI